MCLELSLYRKRKMLLEWDSEGLKSYLERLRGVSCSIGKFLGSCLIGKRGRSLGIRYVFRVLIVFLLCFSFLLLTDPLLRSERLTDPLLWSSNISQDLGHVPGQLAPMSCHFRGSLSI